MEQHDVIIVGGGSAGCVLANRLSADRSLRILLLEAGPTFAPESFPTDLVNADHLGGGAEFDWGYQSEPGRGGHSIAAQSGKVLGGGSAVNAAVAKRARPDDFAQWREHGLEGWEFEQVLETYKDLENTPTGSDAWHGRSGPFPVRQPALPDVTPALRAFVDSSVAMGFPLIEDFNGPIQHGVGVDPFNVIDGIRQNTAMTYLTASVRDRPNLTIRPDSPVDRIELEDNRVSRVHLVDGEELRCGEAILCAGVYGSPGILLRSGIGPADLLRELGIRVVADLPVGEQLLDHPFYYNTYTLKPQARLTHPARGATVWTRSLEAIGDELDLQVTASNLPGSEQSDPTLVLAVAVTRPSSVGCLRLRSRDPRVSPSIDYNLLAVPRDRRRMIEGVKLARRIARTPPLAELLDREITPGSNVVDEAALAHAIESNLDTYHHGTTTVPMGGDSDPLAVVDGAGQVRGLQGLSVIDASVFPEILSTPTNLTTIMVAERLAKKKLRP